MNDICVPVTVLASWVEMFFLLGFGAGVTLAVGAWAGELFIRCIRGLWESHKSADSLPSSSKTVSRATVSNERGKPAKLKNVGESRALRGAKEPKKVKR